MGGSGLINETFEFDLLSDPTSHHSSDRFAVHNKIHNSELILQIFGNCDTIQLESTWIRRASARAISSIIEHHKIHTYST